jgi:hypothetical protein
MFNENDPYFVHPPANLQVLTLDGLLHDAKVKKIKLDPETGDCRLDVTISFTSKFHGLPEDTVYSLIFVNATRMTVTVAVAKSVAAMSKRTETASDERRVEWNATRRTESLGWKAFENLVDEEEYGDIYDADLLRSPEATTVNIGLMLGGLPDWYEVNLSGESLRCERSDGWKGSIDELADMGQAYWDAFGEKSKGARSKAPEPPKV